MFISEIFYSVQGEGLLIGVPSIFIRTSGCNLRCHWCDTPYSSWNPKGKEMGIETIMAHIQQYPSKYVVITGGEPMIAKEIHLLAKALYNKNYHITIETAATIAPKNIYCHLASLSPKLKNSIPNKDHKLYDFHQKNRYQPEVLNSWIAHCEYQLKFVISNVSDFLEISEITNKMASVSPDKIFIMPEGKDLETLKKRCSWLIEECKKRGYRYAPRLHIELFGNTRGT